MGLEIICDKALLRTLSAALLDSIDLLNGSNSSDTIFMRVTMRLYRYLINFIESPYSVSVGTVLKGSTVAHYRGYPANIQTMNGSQLQDVSHSVRLCWKGATDLPATWYPSYAHAARKPRNINILKSFSMNMALLPYLDTRCLQLDRELTASIKWLAEHPTEDCLYYVVGK